MQVPEKNWIMTEFFFQRNNKNEREFFLKKTGPSDDSDGLLIFMNQRSMLPAGQNTLVNIGCRYRFFKGLQSRSGQNPGSICRFCKKRNGPLFFYRGKKGGGILSKSQNTGIFRRRRDAPDAKENVQQCALDPGSCQLFCL